MVNNFDFNEDENYLTFNGYNIIKANMSADFQPITIDSYLDIADEEDWNFEYYFKYENWLPGVEEIVISKNGKEYLVKKTKDGAEISTKGYKRIEDYFESDEYGEACIPVGYTKSGKKERINSFKPFQVPEITLIKDGDNSNALIYESAIAAVFENTPEIENGEYGLYGEYNIPMYKGIRNGVEFCFIETDIDEMTLKIGKDIVTLSINGAPLTLERSKFDKLI